MRDDPRAILIAPVVSEKSYGQIAERGKYTFRGVFHGTPSPDGIVQTLEFEGMPGHVCLETVTFTELGDTTMVTQNTVYQSAQDRDQALRFDMAEDINESIERLEELLTRLVPERTATPIQPAWR